MYVGQARDLERRTKQHLTDKEWWSQIILMTTKDDSFNASDIDYLEASLIDLAEKAGRSDSDNRKKGNPQKVDEFRQAELEQYLEEALFLLELIGIRVFKPNKEKAVTSKSKHASGLSAKPRKGIVIPTSNKPPLPDNSFGPCTYVKTAIKNLIDSGFIFTDEQIKLFGSVEGSKAYTTRNLPLFWLLKDGETRSACDPNIRARYWKEEFLSGSYRFLMYSQWYEDSGKGATKKHFIKWYETL